MTSKVKLCNTNDVLEGTAIRVDAAGLAFAVYNIEGQFYVTDDRCTHGPGSLSEGYVDGHIVECDFHNGQFDIRTGEVVAPPCLVPLKTYQTIVDDDVVFINLG
jgi:nitrite reductase/ring-hydroxylating ferredoxin subunit